MTRRAYKYNYGRKLEPMPQEEPATVMERVKRLPMPGPRIKIRIPLDLYPAYMDLYGLEEIGYRGDVMFYRRAKKEGSRHE